MAAARETHQRYSRRVDAPMCREHGERAVGIEDHVKAAELRLVGARGLDAAGGETVDDERRKPDPVEHLRPAVNIYR